MQWIFPYVIWRQILSRNYERNVPLLVRKVEILRRVINGLKNIKFHISVISSYFKIFFTLLPTMSLVFLVLIISREIELSPNLGICFIYIILLSPSLLRTDLFLLYASKLRGGNEMLSLSFSIFRHLCYYTNTP